MAEHHVLIAGATGVIGSAVLSAFESEGWRITTVGRAAAAPTTHAHITADLLDARALDGVHTVLEAVTHVHPTGRP